MASRGLSWRAVLAETATRLSSETEARWICEQASGARGADWWAIVDESVTVLLRRAVEDMVVRRVAGEPIQLVLGVWGFRGLDLMVDRRVLIPRPETELVVDVALEVLASRTRACVVDLGTGSGAIALSIVAERPVGTVEMWACDLSSDALHVAAANLAGIDSRKGRSVRLRAGSWFDALPAELAGSIDLIVSNPPYIAATDSALDSAVVRWEPHAALFAGVDGLDCYRTIVEDAPSWLRSDGVMVLEIGSTQTEAVRSLADAAGFRSFEARRDLAGLDRVAVLRSC